MSTLPCDIESCKRNRKKEKPCENDKGADKSTNKDTDEGTVVRISDENGQYIMTTYQVFPGVEMIYGDAHIRSVHFEERQSTSDNIFEISHCREGRLECYMNGEFWYLTPGDLAIARTNSISSSACFPLCHYHGITVRIDLDKAPKCLSCFLDDVTVQPKAIADKFCGVKGGFLARANPSFEHIFSELYSVPASIKKGYFKIKVLELLLFLSVLDVKQDELPDRSYTKTQVALAKEVGHYLIGHMNDRITIEQLSGYFHVSSAHIKNTFKGVYGVSVGAYIRAQKMESAAYMLEYTDKSVLEIAGEHGYDNGSKFAGAFRSVKGVTPTEYRNSKGKIAQCKKSNDH